MNSSKSKRRKIDIENLLKKINSEFSFPPFTKIDPLKTDNDDNGSSNNNCDKSKTIHNEPSSSSNVNVPKNKAEVCELFNEIDNFCKISIPFKLDGMVLEPKKVEKSNSSSIENKSIVVKQEPCDNNAVPLPTKRFSLALTTEERTKVRTNQPKTRVELDELFSQIESFCKISVPFKLGDLDELDKIQNDNGKSFKNSVSSEKKLITCETAPIRISRRLALKRSTAEENKQKTSDLQNVSCYAYTNLIFNLNRKDLINSASTADKSIKSNNENCRLTKRNRRVNQKKSIETFQSQTKLKPNANNQNKVSNILNNSPKKSQPPQIDFSSYNLKDRKNFYKQMKSTLKNRADLNVKEEKPKRKYTKKCSNSSSSLSNSSIFTEDYSSGYSSASIPSPAPSLNSCDSTRSQSSMSSSVASSYDSSFYKNVNPNGETVYLRSHLDYYQNKKSNRRSNQRINISDSIDNHQKVLDWRTRTLLNQNGHSSCPTPKHSVFEETPPQSPCDGTQHAQNSENFLDLDCFQEEEEELDQANLENEQQNELDLFLKNYENFAKKPETEQNRNVDDDFSFFLDILN